MNNKDRRLMRLAIMVSALLTITCVALAIYMTQKSAQAVTRASVAEVIANDALNIAKDIEQPKDGKDATPEQIKEAVTEYLAENPPRDGLDGQNATDEQIQRAVDKYMKNNPIPKPKDGKDGKDGISAVQPLDAKTPEIRCNEEKNRWEIRFGSDETWQLLNGKKVSCTIEVE